MAALDQGFIAIGAGGEGSIPSFGIRPEVV